MMKTIRDDKNEITRTRTKIRRTRQSRSKEDFGGIMDIFEFVGKIVFEDVPEIITEKIPREAGKTLDNISEAIDNFLSD